MAITINGGRGVITGVAVGGLPDGVVDSGTLATNSVDSDELINGAIDAGHLASGIIGAVAAGKWSQSYASTASNTQTIGFDPDLVFIMGTKDNTNIMAWAMWKRASATTFTTAGAIILPNYAGSPTTGFSEHNADNLAWIEGSATYSITNLHGSAPWPTNGFQTTTTVIAGSPSGTIEFKYWAIKSQ